LSADDRTEEIISLIRKGKYLDAIDQLLTIVSLEDGKTYHEWWNYRTRGEINLTAKAYEYDEEYFQDMLLSRYTKELPECSANLDGGTEADTEQEISDADFTIDNWIFKLDRLDNCSGMCSSGTRTITIDPNRTADEDMLNMTLLHEMIHAYEFMLPEIYRQYVAVRLFQKLEPLIPNLMDLINADIQSEIREHSVLFMLKALDLDLRLNKPPGTVYSYGRT
jgi:hypothetical protein